MLPRDAARPAHHAHLRSCWLNPLADPLGRLAYQATLLQTRAGGELPFKRMVAECVTTGRYTPAHAILASLRVPAVTTNYDDLYEDVVVSMNDARRVLRLPWDAAEVCRHNNDGIQNNGDLELVKLHGCVRNSESIVLARTDYIRYAAQRQALRGMLTHCSSVSC